MNSRDTMKYIQEGQHIAVMRTDNPETFLDISNLIIEQGLNIIEVTLTTPNAIEIIAELSKRRCAHWCRYCT